MNEPLRRLHELGPRYLHSIGQLHKGGPDSGVFLQLVADVDDLAIPGERFGFGALASAQAAGDLQALQSRGRRAGWVRREDLRTVVDLASPGRARASTTRSS